MENSCKFFLCTTSNNCRPVVLPTESISNAKCHSVSGASLLTADVMNHDYWHRYFPHSMKENRDDPKDLEFFRVVKKHRCTKYRRNNGQGYGSYTRVRDDPDYQKEGIYSS
eukprot:UN04297